MLGLQRFESIRLGRPRWHVWRRHGRCEQYGRRLRSITQPSGPSPHLSMAIRSVRMTKPQLCSKSLFPSKDVIPPSRQIPNIISVFSDPSPTYDFLTIITFPDQPPPYPTTISSFHRSTTNPERKKKTLIHPSSPCIMTKRTRFWVYP